MKLGDYFKTKEQDSASTLKPKGWFVIRLDGKAFHTYTNRSPKPFDSKISEAMIYTAKALCAEVQNIRFAYTQSDEISLILCDLDEEKTQLWFDGKIQKIVSVASSIATANFNRTFKHQDGKLALFDARVFRLDSEAEVNDYLLWRQVDAIKNAVTLISLKHFSHKQIMGVNTSDKIAMIKSKGDDVNNYHQGLVQGFVIEKETRKVPIVHPKAKTSGFVDRNFWVEKTSPKYTKSMG